MIDEDIIFDYDMKKSLLLFSGGLDTTTILYQLVDEGIPVQCLIFDYGQQAKKEIECAVKTCEKLNVDYEVMDITSLNISGNLGEGGNNRSQTSIIIPNRNSIFLAIATNYAISHNCEVVYIGSKLGAEACYDEKYDFIEKYNELNEVSDIKYIPIKAPFIYYDTIDVLDLALDLEVPLIDTWSCFGNKEYRCGECKNCKALPEILDEYYETFFKKLQNLREYKESFNHTK